MYNKETQEDLDRKLRDFLELVATMMCHCKWQSVFDSRDDVIKAGLNSIPICLERNHVLDFQKMGHTNELYGHHSGIFWKLVNPTTGHLCDNFCNAFLHTVQHPEIIEGCHNAIYNRLLNYEVTTIVELLTQQSEEPYSNEYFDHRIKPALTYAYDNLNNIWIKHGAEFAIEYNHELKNPKHFPERYKIMGKGYYSIDHTRLPIIGCGSHGRKHWAPNGLITWNDMKQYPGDIIHMKRDHPICSIKPPLYEWIMLPDYIAVIRKKHPLMMDYVKQLLDGCKGVISYYTLNYFVSTIQTWKDRLILACKL
jgi:hypothetical protein